MTEPAVRQMAVGLADALSLIHSRGLVHRDIKPAKILITAAGIAKLSDFGIARLVGAGHLAKSSYGREN
jgi:serine/threonine-protein kinase